MGSYATVTHGSNRFTRDYAYDAPVSTDLYKRSAVWGNTHIAAFETE